MPAKKSIKFNRKEGLPVFGIILVLLGVAMLLEKYIPNLTPNIWALILVILGVSLIVKHSKF